jgi:hypothetical protein
MFWILNSQLKTFCLISLNSRFGCVKIKYDFHAFMNMNKFLKFERRCIKCCLLPDMESVCLSIRLVQLNSRIIHGI